jgi:hypothetical protein
VGLAADGAESAGDKHGAGDPQPAAVTAAGGDRHQLPSVLPQATALRAVPSVDGKAQVPQADVWLAHRPAGGGAHHQRLQQRLAVQLHPCQPLKWLRVREADAGHQKYRYGPGFRCHAASPAGRFAQLGYAVRPRPS